MGRTHKSSQLLTFSLGGAEHEFDCEIHFEFAPGMPETGAGYMADPYLYDPGSPDEVHITRAYLAEVGSMHEALPGWMFNAIYGDEQLHTILANEVKVGQAS